VQQRLVWEPRARRGAAALERVRPVLGNVRPVPDAARRDRSARQPVGGTVQVADRERHQQPVIGVGGGEASGADADLEAILQEADAAFDSELGVQSVVPRERQARRV
jgi:hypothetical protein